MLNAVRLFVALLLMAMSCNLIAAGALITGRVGDAFGDARIDAEPGDKSYNLLRLT